MVSYELHFVLIIFRIALMMGCCPIHENITILWNIIIIICMLELLYEAHNNIYDYYYANTVLPTVIRTFLCYL